MNNIRWTVTFKTIKERTAVVSIADADYNTEPQAIEPALNTVTIDTLSKSLTDSIRTSTGLHCPCVYRVRIGRMLLRR